MAERPTLLSRSVSVPTAAPSQAGAQSGAFGNASGLITAGRAISNIGEAGMQLATSAKDRESRLRQAQESATVEDMRRQHKAAQVLTVKGVLEERNKRTAAGEVDPSPYTSLETELNTARSAMKQYLAPIAGHRLYRTAVPVDQEEADWKEAIYPHLKAAADKEWQIKHDGRKNELKMIVEGSFIGDPRDHGATIAEMDSIVTTVFKANIDEDQKLPIVNQATARAFNTIARGIQAGVRPDTKVLEHPMLDPSHKKTLASMVEQHFKPKGSFANDTEARNVMNRMISDPNFHAKPESQQIAMLAADHLAKSTVDPSSAEAEYAKVHLARLYGEISQNNYAAFRTKDKSLFDGLRDASLQLKNKESVSKLFDSFGIKGADTADKEAFFTKLESGIAKTLDLIETGQANAVAERIPSVADIAGIAAAEFSSAQGISIDTAQRYIEVSKIEQTRMGIPAELQVHIPSAAVSLLLENIWSGDTARAHRMITNMGEGFGSAALESVSASLLRPMKRDSGDGKMSDPKNASYAALLKIAAHDQQRYESGVANHEFRPVLKSYLDALNNWEKNNATFPVRSKLVAHNAFQLGSWSNPATTKELLTGKQLGDERSYTQSLTGIADALYWHSGQNNDMRAAFQTFGKRIIEAEAYGQSLPDTSQEDAHEGAAAASAKKLIGALSSIWTVVDVGAMNNGRRTLDIIPTVMDREDALSMPIKNGAASAPDLGEQVGNVLRYIDHYDPRRKWDRSYLGNFGVWVAETSGMLGGRLSSMLAPHSPSIATLPAHLSVQWEKVAGYGLAQSRKPDDTFAGTIANRINLSGDPHTNASLAYDQKGAWRFNWKTNEFEAMLYPARFSPESGQSIEIPGPAQPMYYNYGTAEKPLAKKVSVKLQDVRDFDFVWRRARALKFAENYTLPAP